MGLGNISLESAVRTNLVALQGITSKMGKVEERLATGKDVNQIIDNPSNFFMARGLNDRASSLNARLDGMSNSIQTITAANQGIDAIRSLLSNAKALANDAMAKGDIDERRAIGEQFNMVIEQAYEIATDASYNGINLLEGNQGMVIEFGDSNGDSSLRVNGLDIQGQAGNGVSEVSVTSTATRASAASAGTVSGITSQAQYNSVASTASAGTTAFVSSQASQSSVASVATKSSQGTVASSGSQVSQASRGTTTSSASQSSLASASAIMSQASGGTAASIASQASIASRTSAASAGTGASVSVSFTQRFAVSLQVDASDPSETVGLRKHLTNAPDRNGDHRVDFGSSNYLGVLGEITREIDSFDSALNTQASRLSTSLNVIQVRQSFTNDLINTLEQGADNLVLADMNEEGANLLTLQTRQALAVQSLSISTTQSQQVLNLLI